VNRDRWGGVVVYEGDTKFGDWEITTCRTLAAPTEERPGCAVRVCCEGRVGPTGRIPAPNATGVNAPLPPARTRSRQCWAEYLQLGESTRFKGSGRQQSSGNAGINRGRNNHGKAADSSEKPAIGTATHAPVWWRCPGGRTKPASRGRLLGCLGRRNSEVQQAHHRDPIINFANEAGEGHSLLPWPVFYWGCTVVPCIARDIRGIEKEKRPVLQAAVSINDAVSFFPLKYQLRMYFLGMINRVTGPGLGFVPTKPSIKRQPQHFVKI
jgi:hypothetical protein